MHVRQGIAALILMFWLTVFYNPARAQQDSSGSFIDSFLLKQKGLLGKLAKNLVAEKPDAISVTRNDLNFSRWRNKTIRYIIIKRLDFGVAINDTSHGFSTTLTKWANAFHHKTGEDVIRNNLFFREGERVRPELMSDNERHLRDLDYLQDADIRIVRAGRDSVDVIVQTKDVLSIGGSYRMHSTKRMSLSFFEDNLAGLGHKLLLRTLYDNDRDPRMGYGAEYRARNISGSFADWYGGFINFNKNINTGAQSEKMIYTGFVRPLVHPYIKFTYAAEYAKRKTADVYPRDSVYASDHVYSFENYDAWIGWNSGAFKLFGYNPDNRLRTLVGARLLKNEFERLPAKFADEYYYLYSDLDAILASISVFRQDYYKTQYFYGLGRNEDIPEGMTIALTGGWTKKANIDRPYLGVDFQRYFFTVRESYFNYEFKAGSFFHRGKLEDINLLTNLDYFSRLRHLGRSWKLRYFITGSIAYQPKLFLNEPLFLQSDFGLREFRSDTVVLGKKRFTLKAESVFFAPWSLANFRFAPLVFCNLSFFTPLQKKTVNQTVYSSVGAGLRIRNESLIFETAELRGFFFPNEDLMGNHFRFEVNTHIRFKYNRQFIRRPDFVNMNGL